MVRREKRKVALVCVWYPDLTSSDSKAGRYMATTVVYFARLLARKFRVRVYCRSKDLLYREERDGDVEVVRIPVVDIPGIRLLFFLVQTVRGILTFKPNVAMAWDWSSLFPGWIVKMFQKLLIVCSFRGVLQSYYLEEVAKKRRLAWIYRRFEKFIIPKADLLAFNSKNTKENVLGAEYGAEVPFEMALNGVDLGVFRPDGAKVEFEGVGPHFLYVGRLSEEKGVFELVRAFKRVKKGTLHFLGDGELRDELYSEAKSLRTRVVFHGEAPANEVPGFLRAADAVVLASSIEGFGSSILEGMACGTLVIASDGTGGRDVIENGSNGLLVRAGDVDGLKGALEFVVANPEKVRRMAKKGAETAKKFTWERTSRDLIEALELLG